MQAGETLIHWFLLWKNLLSFSFYEKPINFYIYEIKSFSHCSYYFPSEVNVNAMNERVYIELYDPSVTSWNTSTYCNPSSPPKLEEYHVMVKKGWIFFFFFTFVAKSVKHSTIIVFITTVSRFWVSSSPALPSFPAWSFHVHSRYWYNPKLWQQFLPGCLSFLEYHDFWLHEMCHRTSFLK